MNNLIIHTNDFGDLITSLLMIPIYVFMEIFNDIIQGLHNLSNMSPINQLASIILFFFYCGVSMILGMVGIAIITKIWDAITESLFLLITVILCAVGVFIYMHPHMFLPIVGIILIIIICLVPAFIVSVVIRPFIKKEDAIIENYKNKKYGEPDS